MRTVLLVLAIGILTPNIYAQEQTTSFEDIAIVTTAAGKSVELSWKKGTEDISHFIVERSINGVDFKLCGLVFLSEVPGFSDYKFRDRVISGRPFYYRIGLVKDDQLLSYLPARVALAP